jgi:hypothetical protein
MKAVFGCMFMAVLVMGAAILLSRLSRDEQPRGTAHNTVVSAIEPINVPPIIGPVERVMIPADLAADCKFFYYPTGGEVTREKFRGLLKDGVQIKNIRFFKGRAVFIMIEKEDEE